MLTFTFSLVPFDFLSLCFLKRILLLEILYFFNFFFIILFCMWIFVWLQGKPINIFSCCLCFSNTRSSLLVYWPGYGINKSVCSLCAIYVYGFFFSPYHCCVNFWFKNDQISIYESMKIKDYFGHRMYKIPNEPLWIFGKNV